MPDTARTTAQQPLELRNDIAMVFGSRIRQQPVLIGRADYQADVARWRMILVRAILVMWWGLRSTEIDTLSGSDVLFAEASPMLFVVVTFSFIHTD